jgi:hypothetical protein
MKKACWVATKTRAGWRLKLSYGPRDYSLPGLLLGDEAEVLRVCQGLGIVNVHMRECGCKRCETGDV